MKEIVIRDWDSNCSDGCCYIYGTSVHIDGEEVTQYADLNLEGTIIGILEKFGLENNKDYIIK